MNNENNQVKNLQTELSATKNKLTDSERNLINLKTNYGNLEQKNKDLATKSSLLEKELENTFIKFSQINQELITVKEINKNLENKITDLEKELLDLKEQANSYDWSLIIPLIITSCSTIILLLIYLLTKRS